MAWVTKYDISHDQFSYQLTFITGYQLSAATLRSVIP